MASVTTGGLSGRGGYLLPTGYLSTEGNQIIDADGNTVRIDSIGWGGTDSLTFAPYGLWQSSLQQNVDAIKADGFNTIRIPWSDLLLTHSPVFRPGYAAFNPALDPELIGLTGLQLLDVLVADAAKDGLKVIFDHHDNDGGPGGWGGQQANGLWFDSGPGSNNTDGSGTPGTITAAQFQADSVALAAHFAGNSTVIGFDLDNEPNSSSHITWGGGGPTDIQAMYTTVGNAVQAADPGALIIAEGPEEWSGPAPGLPAGFAEGDLSGVAKLPVTLNQPDKIVYSVHEYPPDLSGNGSYVSTQQIAAMNAGWGYLLTQSIAPVFIGEIGSNGTNAADQAWIQTVLDYVGGKDAARGGPAVTGNAQAASISWWQWGAAPGQDPQGVETAWGSGSYRPAQQAFTDQLLFASKELIGATFGSGPDSIVLHVAEDAWEGDAAFTVSVDGTAVGGNQVVTASHANNQDETFTVLGSFGTGLHTIGLDFINDAYGGSPSIDRNVYVNSISYAGTTISEDAAQFSNGTSLYTIGTPGAGVSVGSGPDAIVVQISEDAWDGDAAFALSIDGVTIGSPQVATAAHAAGKDQAFTVLGNFGPGLHTVGIDFLNDAYGGSPSMDRNLYVDQISYAGITTTENSAQDSAGLVVYSIGEASGAVTVGAGPDDIVLHIAEDAWQGDALFTVSVDGVKIGGTEVASVSRSSSGDQTFNVQGTFGAGPHTIGVDFLNDAYGGSPATDRNLYVNSIGYGGVVNQVHGVQLSGGLQEYTIAPL